jgi:acetyl/propionyl-CoA carboxylase alpha subunit
VSKPADAITPLGRGLFRVDGTDRQRLAYAVADGARTWVFLDGDTFIIEPPRTRRASAGADDASLAAPMPATVTEIHVTAGQHVEAGDVLVTLEAMKMELAIKSPRAGRVKAVNCEQAQLVQPGVALITLAEPEPEPNAEPEHEPRPENQEP